MEVVISTSKLNSYGGRVLTGGIDFSQYQKNPIVLWMHNRPWGDRKDEPLPIGKMENLRVEGDKLIGSVVFDENDEFAMQIKGKYDKGILNMVSAGLDVVELTDDLSSLLPGQRRMTISKSRLREVSCVDIGANDDSLKLYYNNMGVQLDSELDKIVPLLAKRNKNLNETNMEMKEVFKILNLKEGSDENAVVQAINDIKKKAEKTDTLEQQLGELREKKLSAMVDDAINGGRLASDKRGVFLQIGKQNGEEVLKNALESLQAPVDVSKALNKDKKSDIELSAQTWDKMDKEGTLAALKQSDKATYDKLFNIKFGK